MLPPAEVRVESARAKAVVTVPNHVRGDHGPLASVLWGGFLAVPELRFGTYTLGSENPYSSTKARFTPCCCTKSSTSGRAWFRSRLESLTKA